MRTTNFTDLRNNLKKYLDAVTNDSDTVIINRDGGIIFGAKKKLRI